MELTFKLKYYEGDKVFPISYEDCCNDFYNSDYKWHVEHEDLREPQSMEITGVRVFKSGKTIDIQYQIGSHFYAESNVFLTLAEAEASCELRNSEEED